MNKDLVSVVIPTYNCVRLIGNAINSVLNQTHKNYELIVVDDGSTDNTKSFLNSYFDKVKYISQENGGVSKARNTGISHSSGDYIAFLDADDVWDEKKLEMQMICFQKYRKVSMIFSDFKQMKDGKILDNKKFENAFNIFREYRIKKHDIFDCHVSFLHSNVKYEFYWGNIYKYLFLGNFILPSSVIIKKDSLENVGLFDEKYKVAEDTELFLRYSKINNIGFINFPLLLYNIPSRENLSGKKYTETLIKNAIKIQIDSILNNPNYYRNNKYFMNKGLSMSYCRLAYYYLTEYKMCESRKFAWFGINTYFLNIKSIMIWFITFIPYNLLKKAALIKSKSFD